MQLRGGMCQQDSELAREANRRAQNMERKPSDGHGALREAYRAMKRHGHVPCNSMFIAKHTHTRQIAVH